MEQLTKEVNRYFRLYSDFCESPNEEVVNNLVSSAYRVNERLKKATFNKRTFGLDVDFFMLRALRNHFTHAGEIESDLKAFNKKIMMSLTPELLLVCLVPRKVINTAINKLNNFELAAKVSSQLQDLDGYIDIHPYIFNFSVKLFKESFILKLNIEGEGYKNIKRSYKVEEVYDIEHFIKPYSLDTLKLNSPLSDALIPLDEFIVQKKAVDDHRGLVGMHFWGKEVSPDLFDTDALVDQLFEKTKTLNGLPISLYSELLNDFELWANSPIPNRLLALLDFNTSYINNAIDNNIKLSAKFSSEKVRYKILSSKRLVVSCVFSTLLQSHNEKQMKYALYCALIIAYQIVLDNESEGKCIKPLFDSVLFESDIKKANRTFDKFKKRKQNLLQSKFLISSQMVMMLVELPFDDFIKDAVI